jgi:hypothetical protein
LIVKNHGDLANTLGMAFSNYANRVQNGDVAPYKDFLAGADSVYIQVTLKPNGSIVVADGSEVEALKAETQHLEGKVKDQEKEIKSLNLVLAQTLEEKEKQKEEIEEPSHEESPPPEPESEEKQTKKKRRAKQK